MTPLRRAYLQWLALRPEPGRKCCDHPHYYVGASEKPLGDCGVCDREKAWREYVRLRDGDPEYPFHKRRVTREPGVGYNDDTA